MNGVQALRNAVRESLKHSSTHLLGEAVELSPITRGLSAEFPGQVHALPASDAGLIGLATGMALGGATPIVELSGPDALWGAIQQLGQEAAAFASNPEFQATLVVRVPSPPGSGDLSPLLASVPGLAIAAAGQAGEAADLLRAALGRRGPTVIVEPSDILTQDISEDEPLPLGKARILRAGTQVTALAWGAGVPAALAAAEDLAARGVSLEVLDLRTLNPLDEAAIAESVHRTGRALLVGGAATVLVATVRAAFLRLEAPPAAVAALPSAIADAAIAALNY